MCVGGIDVDTGAGVRLLGHDGQYLLAEHRIRPREIWSLRCSPSEPVEPPHVEDIVVTSGSRLEVVPDMRAAILKLVSPWDGRPRQNLRRHPRDDIEWAGVRA